MAPLSEFVALVVQVVREWFRHLLHPLWELVITHPEHWASGAMFGLSIASTIFIGDPEIPRTISIGTVIAFIAAAVKYISQNLETIKQHIRNTALTMLAIGFMLFHGVTNWMTPAAWLPVFTSITLLATVHIAPGVMEVLIRFGAGFSRLLDIGDHYEIPGERIRDIELGQPGGLVPEMSENPGAGYQGSEDIEFTISHMREVDVSVFRDEGTDESVDLDDSTVITRPSIALWMRVLDPAPRPPLQDAALAHIVPTSEQNVFFPETPHDQLPGGTFPGGVQELSLEHPLPG